MQPLDHAELSRRIAAVGLGRFDAELQALAMPCVQFTTSRAAAPLPATESKLGGDPDLPRDRAWPVDNGGHPLLFLGRIVESDLRRIHPHLRGHLLFFGDWDSQAGEVVQLPADAALETRPHPPRLPEDLPRLTECRLHFVPWRSLPHDRDPITAWQYSPALRAAGEDAFAFPGGRRTTRLRALLAGLEQPSSPELARPHRLFGHPLFTQSHPAELAEQAFTRRRPETEAEFRRLAGSRWTALLSLETDAAPQLYFHDTGNCGFLVTREALAAGDFRRCEFYQDEC